MKAHALALFTILVWSTTFVAALVWSVYSTLVDRIADAGYETLAATKRIFAWGREHSLSWEDLAATATELTAWSIADAYERYVLPKYKAAELLVGGGGSYNKTLMSRLAARFERFGVEVKTQEDLGYSSDAKEAVAFAILGDRCLAGLPNTLPGVTGAENPSVMGKISLPPL